MHPTENLIYLRNHHGGNSLVFVSVQCARVCVREREREGQDWHYNFKDPRENQTLWTLRTKYIFICNMIRKYSSASDVYLILWNNTDNLYLFLKRGRFLPKFFV